MRLILGSLEIWSMSPQIVMRQEFRLAGVQTIAVFDFGKFFPLSNYERWDPVQRGFSAAFLFKKKSGESLWEVDPFPFIY